MKIQLNGHEIEVSAGLSLLQLIENQGFAGKRLAAEVNREIVPKSEHKGFELHEHDCIEIVHAIGGG
ncbi:MAG TPA: sulfur carrier protein ThiS [Gammaproteobacteria bacterium]|nr:sulfur carrier protein ThiS [Gammaproteobacteria bacterium]